MDCDCLIIGAGVVGLAIAQRLSLKYNCVLTEEHSTFGFETSSRNSEVIHSGIYYPQNSLKTQLCLRGNQLLYEHCHRYNVPHLKCGKFIISIIQEEDDYLYQIFQNGINNGVQNLEKTTTKQLKASEPFIKASQAVFAGDTGIIDSHRLMYSLESLAISQGCLIAYNHKVISLEKILGGWRTSFRFNDDIFSIDSAIVINSAGLNSDEVAKLAGLDVDNLGLDLSYSKGHYFKIINSKLKFNHLIYPVPEKSSSGLGVHVTIDLNHSAKLGPDTQYMNGRDQDYSVSADLHEKFHIAAKRYIPTISRSDIAPDYSGIRPKLQKPDGEFQDFYICQESNKNMSGLINLIGIESPGLTSSLAIAEYVEGLL